jgi:hypothetical protein
LAGHLGDQIVVMVVMEHCQPGGFGGRRDNEIRDGHAVAAGAGELRLNGDRPLEDLLGDRNGLVRERPRSRSLS